MFLLKFILFLYKTRIVTNIPMEIGFLSECHDLLDDEDEFCAYATI